MTTRIPIAPYRLSKRISYQEYELNDFWERNERAEAPRDRRGPNASGLGYRENYREDLTKDFCYAKQVICLFLAGLPEGDFIPALLQARESLGIRVYVLTSRDAYEAAEQQLNSLAGHFLIRIIDNCIGELALIDPTDKSDARCFAICGNPFEERAGWICEMSDPAALDQLFHFFSFLFWKEARYEISEGGLSEIGAAPYELPPLTGMDRILFKAGGLDTVDDFLRSTGDFRRICLCASRFEPQSALVRWFLGQNSPEKLFVCPMAGENGISETVVLMRRNGIPVFSPHHDKKRLPPFTGILASGPDQDLGLFFPDASNPDKSLNVVLKMDERIVRDARAYVDFSASGWQYFTAKPIKDVTSPLVFWQADPGRIVEVVDCTGQAVELNMVVADDFNTFEEKNVEPDFPCAPEPLARRIEYAWQVNPPPLPPNADKDPLYSEWDRFRDAVKRYRDLIAEQVDPLEGKESGIRKTISEKLARNDRKSRKTRLADYLKGLSETLSSLKHSTDRFFNVKRFQIRQFRKELESMDEKNIRRRRDAQDAIEKLEELKRQKEDLLKDYNDRIKDIEDTIKREERRAELSGKREAASLDLEKLESDKRDWEARIVEIEKQKKSIRSDIEEDEEKKKKEQEKADQVKERVEDARKLVRKIQKIERRAKGIETERPGPDASENADSEACLEKLRRRFGDGGARDGSRQPDDVEIVGAATAKLDDYERGLESFDARESLNDRIGKLEDEKRKKVGKRRKNEIKKEIKKLREELKEERRKMADKIPDFLGKEELQEKKENLETLLAAALRDENFLSGLKKTGDAFQKEKTKFEEKERAAMEVVESIEEKQASGNKHLKDLNAELLKTKSDLESVAKKIKEKTARKNDIQEELETLDKNKRQKRKTTIAPDESLSEMMKNPAPNRKKKKDAFPAIEPPKEDLPQIGTLYRLNEDRFLQIRFWDEAEDAKEQSLVYGAKIVVGEDA